MSRNNGLQLGDKCQGCDTILTEQNCVMIKRIYLSRLCRNCKRNQNNKWASENGKQIRKTSLQRKYGISLEEYERKFKLQLGGCAICKQPCESGDSLSVDHNHETGQIRDLLCKKCNILVGTYEENELLLLEIADYLKRHEVVNV